MIKKICLLLGMTLLLTGCMKVETEITVNKDGSAVVKNRFLMDKQLANMGGKNAFEESTKKYANDPNSTVVPIETADMSGVEATKNIKDINNDSWNTTMDTENFKTKNPDGKFISIKKGFFKTVYTVDAEADMVPKANGTDALSQSQSQANMAGDMFGNMNLDDMFKVVYTIKLPVKADSTNATTSDNEKFIYSWQLKNNAVTPMKLQCTIYNTANIVITVVVLLILGALLFVYYYKPQTEE